jgi:hypothetical protein
MVPTLPSVLKIFCWLHVYADPSLMRTTPSVVSQSIRAYASDCQETLMKRPNRETLLEHGACARNTLCPLSRLTTVDPFPYC